MQGIFNYFSTCSSLKIYEKGYAMVLRCNIHSLEITVFGIYLVKHRYKTLLYLMTEISYCTSHIMKCTYSPKHMGKPNH